MRGGHQRRKPLGIAHCSSFHCTAASLFRYTLRSVSMGNGATVLGVGQLILFQVFCQGLCLRSQVGLLSGVKLRENKPSAAQLSVLKCKYTKIDSLSCRTCLSTFDLSSCLCGEHQKILRFYLSEKNTY